VLARWAGRKPIERERPRTAQSFCVPKADIAAQGYDLSLNRYKEVVHEEVEHRAPKEILAELAKLEEEIQRGMKELEGMLRSRIALPPLPEQRRIAEILDKADALRAKRRAALAQLDTLTQSIFLDMFGDLTTLLERWPTKTLADLLDFLTSGSRGWAQHYVERGDLFLRIQNVRRDELTLE
jgi:chromatin segregation and condensation protein Rec8/ScpA/Scc1 (kleisin family)